MRLSCLILLLLLAPSQSRQAEPAAGSGAESFQYSAEWRLIRAGDVKLELRSASGGREARLEVRSTGLVSMLFPLEDLYLAQLSDSLCTMSTVLTAKEGSRSRDTRVTYDAQRQKASYLERDLKKNVNIASLESDIPACVHDVVGGLLSLRTMNIPVGKSANIALSDGKKSVMARVEAQQQENITTPAGRYSTVRYEAFLFNNVLYRRPGRLQIWLTDDQRRLPVQIQVRLQLYIGTITLQLEKVQTS